MRGDRGAAVGELAGDRAAAILGALGGVDDAGDAVRIVHRDDATARRPIASAAISAFRQLAAIA
jgi:hypothetical protein